MVMAKMHIICGNCGCNHMFTYRIITEEGDEDEEDYTRVSIICGNCSTIHDLEDNAEEEK